MVHHKLCEESIQLIILNKCIIIHMQHLQHEGKLLLENTTARYMEVCRDRFPEHSRRA